MRTVSRLSPSFGCLTQSPLPGIFATAAADGSPDLLRPSHKEGVTKSHDVDAESAETQCLRPNSLAKLGVSNTD